MITLTSKDAEQAGKWKKNVNLRLGRVVFFFFFFFVIIIYLVLIKDVSQQLLAEGFPSQTALYFNKI